jgi:NAD(P)-dependent dehydrogenase (short-subunit alcohol dehydrogenase family)
MRMIQECDLEGIALVLAESGADITVTARTVKEIEQTAEEVRHLGRKALAVPADVTKADEIKQVVESTLSEFGKIDILVNNAGIVILKPAVFVRGIEPPPWQGILGWNTQLSEEEWHRVIDTNLTSAFLFIQAVAPHMIRKKKGKVINISSNSDDLAPPYFSAYSVSKAGLSMLTRCFASELAPFNICVNAIGPGHIPTPMTAKTYENPELKRSMLQTIPLGRAGDPREIGLLALYLASAASDYMTGEILHLDGGQLMRGHGS